jgi:hypothetical protein
MKKAIALMLLAITVFGVAYVATQAEPKVNDIVTAGGTGDKSPPRKIAFSQWRGLAQAFGRTFSRSQAIR